MAAAGLSLTPQTGRGRGVIITEFGFQSPVLRESFDAVPGATVTQEQFDAVDESNVRLLVWVEGDDLGEFRGAMAEDPSVDGVDELTDVGERRLYQLQLSPEGTRASVYPKLSEVGGVVRSMEGGQDGWTCTAMFPDKDALGALRSFLREQDATFTLNTLFSEPGSFEESEIRLTDEQQSTVHRALEGGYYDIPRETQLTELSDELDISHQACSERLRRAHESLAEAAVTESGGERP